MRLRIIYFLLAVLTICIGISARAVKAWFPDWINLWLGDLLYAVMMYFLVAAFCVKGSAQVKAFIALAICFCIEFSQLYQGEWLNDVRATLPGKLVLGNGFLCSDLIAYSAGILAVACIDHLWLSPKKTTA
jgi:hypothetical protein